MMPDRLSEVKVVIAAGIASVTASMNAFLTKINHK